MRQPGRRGTIPPVPKETLVETGEDVTVPSGAETLLVSLTATERTVLTLATCTGEWAARVNVYLNSDYQDGRSLNSASPNAVVPFDLDLTVGDVVEVKALQESGVDRLYDASIHAYTW